MAKEGERVLKAVSLVQSTSGGLALAGACALAFLVRLFSVRALAARYVCIVFFLQRGKEMIS